MWSVHSSITILALYGVARSILVPLQPGQVASPSQSTRKGKLAYQRSISKALAVPSF